MHSPPPPVTHREILGVSLNTLSAYGGAVVAAEAAAEWNEELMFSWAPKVLDALGSKENGKQLVALQGR